MGTMSLEHVRTRKVYIKNVSPSYYYTDLTIHSPNGNLLLSFNPSTGIWGESIVITGEFAPKAIQEFYIRLQAPPLLKTGVPYHFYDDLVITSAIDYMREM
jgi:hypothetical protein